MGQTKKDSEFKDRDTMTLDLMTAESWNVSF